LLLIVLILFFFVSNSIIVINFNKGVRSLFQHLYIQITYAISILILIATVLQINLFCLLHPLLLFLRLFVMSMTT
jgi:hypothetical protein